MSSAGLAAAGSPAGDLATAAPAADLAAGGSPAGTLATAAPAGDLAAAVPAGPGALAASVDGPAYPIALDLSGRAVVVVGGGHVALRRTRALADAGAVVTVMAGACGDRRPGR
jgi:hypothetical protein